MTLKFEGYEIVTCPTCKGKGTVPAPVTYNCNQQMIRGGGFPVPCPQCKGKKVVAE